MNGGSTCAPGSRVLVLARDPSAVAVDLKELEASGLRCIRISSCFEAAAEALAAPALALVIDLGLLGSRQLRLLEIARRMELEVLAFGNMPAGLSTAELSRVRLISCRDLAQAVRRLAEAELTQGRAATAGTGSDETPAKVAAPRRPMPAPAGNAAGTYQPNRPEDLLTPEELSALLGEES